MRVKRAFLYLTVAVTFLSAALFAFLWIHERLCYRNTVYSTKFSGDAFARITSGMPRAAVVEALGSPLVTSVNRNYPIWALQDLQARSRYAGREEISLEFLMFSQPKDSSQDFNWVHVSVGPDDLVVATSSYITD
jgi:hypothetical protein